jgi:hypothetical protein
MSREEQLACDLPLNRSLDSAVANWTRVDFDEFCELLTSRNDLERAYLDDDLRGVRDKSTGRIYVIDERQFYAEFRLTPPEIPLVATTRRCTVESREESGTPG